ncbi:putative uncharacterized protein [Streptomyces azureus]|uniref:Uncharacterized protein n=1 Tax=Streptomyces azureus TaxID=146537 RepID=A0A0K8PS36_STRAJ|nr:putative uncharacterized protein [Streptomyces azureus]
MTPDWSPDPYLRRAPPWRRRARDLVDCARTLRMFGECVPAVPPPETGRHRRRQLRSFALVRDHATRTYTYAPDRRFTSEDLGMAAEPRYPNTCLAQLAEPLRPGRPRTGARP